LTALAVGYLMLIVWPWASSVTWPIEKWFWRISRVKNSMQFCYSVFTILSSSTHSYVMAANIWVLVEKLSLRGAERLDRSV